MGSYRIFVEKYPEFQVEAASLLAELNENLQLKLKKLRLLNVYDLFDFTPELLEKSRYSVFGEIVTDQVTDSVDLSKYIAVEFLPGQFDQRAASAVDCVHLIDPKADIAIKSSKLIIVDDDASDEVLDKIRHYVINPVESREKDLSKLSDTEHAAVKEVPLLEGFRNMTDEDLTPYRKNAFQTDGSTKTFLLDGTIDDEASFILDKLAEWFAVNSEAVYGTRPWRVFGEGETRVKIDGFTEEKTDWNRSDIRFVQKDGAVYAFLMGAAAGETVTLRSFAEQEVHSVELLGAGPVPFAKDFGVRAVQLPERLPSLCANTLKIL